MITEAQRRGFHRDAVLPAVPEGMQIVKFHGEPALIPARAEGEPFVGKSQFTQAQVEALEALERARLSQVREDIARMGKQNQI